MTRFLLLCGVALGTLALAPAAHGFVYWSNLNSIGRANLNGGGVDRSFIGTTADGGVAVDGGHIYWATIGAVARANLNGSSPNAGFITGASLPQGVAVDSDHVYWANFGSNTVGRAAIDGGAPQQDFITADNGVRGVAVDSAHVYWTNLQDNSTIGRADLDGLNPDNAFIPDAFFPVAVTVHGGHIYWANQGTNSIARADLDGLNADQNFITGADSPEGVVVRGGFVYWTNHGGGTIGRAPLANPNGPGKDQSFIDGVFPSGIAVDGLSVPSCRATSASTDSGEAVAITLPCTSGGGARMFSLRSQPAHGEISGFSASTGRLTYTPEPGFAGTDSFRYRASNPGATSNTATATVFVRGAGEVDGQPSNEFTFAGVDRNKKKGTAKLTVEVPGAGALELRGKKVKGATQEAAGAGEVTLPVKAKGKARKKLRRKGKAKVTAEVTFSPEGGEPRTQAESLRLVKKK